jgi:hypothetical protein
VGFRCGAPGGPAVSTKEKRSALKSELLTFNEILIIIQLDLLHAYHKGEKKKKTTGNNNVSRF